MYKIKLSQPHWFKANLVMRPIFSGKRCLSQAVSQPVVEYCEKIPGVVFFPILEKKNEAWSTKSTSRHLNVVLILINVIIFCEWLFIMIIYFFWIIFVFIGWVSFFLFDVFYFYHHLTSLRSILKTLNISLFKSSCNAMWRSSN